MRTIILAAAMTGCADDDAVDDPQASSADAAAFVACPDSIPEFAVGLRTAGEQGSLGATLLDADRFPPRKYGNEWDLELASADGETPEEVQITELSAFMPVHGHFGKPAATFQALTQPGQVRAQIHFTMRGPWEVRIDASSPSTGADHIVFEVCVEE